MWRLWISMYHLRGVDLRASVELGGNGEVRLVCDGRSLEPQALGDCRIGLRRHLKSTEPLRPFERRYERFWRDGEIRVADHPLDVVP